MFKWMYSKEKGQYGYTDLLKKRYLVTTLFLFVTVLIFFLTGLLIYHTNKSIFAVMAAVSALPAAKMLTQYIAVRKYSTASGDMYDTIKDAVQDKYLIGADLLLTSRETLYNIQFVCINNGKIVCYTEDKKNSPKDTETYIKTILNSSDMTYGQIKVFSDKDKYIKYLNEIEASSTDTSMKDKRILDRLCAFSM